jgi:hypothetical protein
MAMSWEPHYEFWCRHVVAQWAARQVAPEPVEDVSPWQVEKARNRLQRITEKVERRRWLPTMANRLSGKALQELRSAHELLQEAGDVLTEVRE